MIPLLLVLAQAAPLPEICSRPDVVSLAVPLRHANRESPAFTYRYQFIEATPRRADAPTAVVLPGGPGQAAIGNATTTFSLGAIPATVDRIYTDPRGAGCNAVEPMADSAMLTTESLARDVIAVITARKLNNYVLYGASYGTVLATTVAGIIAREGVAPPRAVVLEGVVGRAFPDFATYMNEFKREWQRMKPRLPDKWGERLSRDPPPYGYTPAQWGSLIAATLILGDIAFPPYNGPMLTYALRGIDRYQKLKQAGQLSRMTKADSAAMAYAEARMGIYGGFAPQPSTPSRASLFRTIACAELWGDWQNGRALRGGELVAEGANICTNTKTNAFDAAKWPFPFPTYYFQGPFDPTSALAGARYHFDQHTTAPRTFVLVDGASHAPLTGGLRSCAPALWERMVQGREIDAAVLARCPRKATTTTTKATENR